MYQKSALAMTIVYLNTMLVGAWLCTEGIVGEKILAGYFARSEQSTDAFYEIRDEEKVTSLYLVEEENKKLGSGNLEIELGVMKKAYCICMSETDYDTLLRIVEAEAGSEDETGKLLVANVVINRVKSSKFPNNVHDVVYQRKGNVSQFTPVSNGKIDEVTITDSTRMVVESALLGQDISKGALYFVNRKVADPERMKWFDEHLVQLFSYGGHEFFL